MTDTQLRERIVEMTVELDRLRKKLTEEERANEVAAAAIDLTDPVIDKLAQERNEALACLREYYDEICEWEPARDRPKAHYRAASIIARCA